MANEEVIGRLLVQLGVDASTLSPALKKALTQAQDELKRGNEKMSREAKAGQARIQSIVSSLNADRPRKAMFELGQAVQQMGGVAALSEGQVARLRKEVERLSAAGAKAPKSLASLVPATGGVSAALTSLVSGGGISGALSAIGPAGIVAAGAVGLVAGAAAKAAGAVAHLAGQAEKWSNVSEATGISVMSVQKLQDYLEDAGFSADDLSSIMKKLQNEVDTGGKGFAQYGIEVEKIKRLAPEEQLKAVAAAVVAIEDPTRRAAAATEFFGKSGAEHMAALRGIASGTYTELSALTQKEIDDLKRMDDALDQAGRSWENWKKRALYSMVSGEIGSAIANTTKAIFGLGASGPAKAGAMSFGALARISDPKSYLDQSPLTLGDQEAATKLQLAAKAAEDKAAANKKAADEAEREAQAITDILNKNLANLRSRVGLEQALRPLDQIAPTAANLGAYVQMGPVRNLNPNLRIGGQNIDLSEEARIELLRQNTKELGDTVEDTAQAASAATDKFGGVATAMMAMGGVLGKLGTALAAITGGIGVFKDLGTLKDAKGNAVGGFSFGNLKASMKTTEGKLQAGQAAAAGLGALGNMLGGKNSVAGSALGGAAAGAQMGAIAGPWGMAAGAVIGGAIGWFKGSKLKKEAKEAGKILGKSVSVEQLQAMKEEAKAAGVDWKTYLKKQKAEEEKAAKVEARQKLESGLAAAAQAAESLLAKIADGSVKSSAAIQGLFAAVNDQLIKNGIGILDGRLSESKAYTGAAGGAGDVAAILAGMRQAGVLDANVSALGGQAAADLQAQARQAALDAGLSASEADRAGLAAIAPLLREQLNASVQSGKELDEKTKQLLEEAKKNGIEILADPALEQLDVAKEQLDVLKAIEKKKGGAIGAAGGFGPVMTKDLGGGLGPLIQTHPGELAMVLPAHLAKRGGIISASRGLYEDERDIGGGGSPGAPGGGGGGGGMGDDAGALPPGAVAELRAAVVEAVAAASAPQVTAPITMQVKVDPLMDAQTREAAIDNLLDAAADRLAAGTHRLSREIDRKIRESRQAA